MVYESSDDVLFLGSPVACRETLLRSLRRQRGNPSHPFYHEQKIATAKKETEDALAALKTEREAKLASRCERQKGPVLVEGSWRQ